MNKEKERRWLKVWMPIFEWTLLAGMIFLNVAMLLMWFVNN
jgi:hypothetical protein